MTPARKRATLLAVDSPAFTLLWGDNGPPTRDELEALFGPPTDTPPLHPGPHEAPN